jgi:hypothetical protein
VPEEAGRAASWPVLAARSPIERHRPGGRTDGIPVAGPQNCPGGCRPPGTGRMSRASGQARTRLTTTTGSCTWPAAVMSAGGAAATVRHAYSPNLRAITGQYRSRRWRTDRRLFARWRRPALVANCDPIPSSAPRRSPNRIGCQLLRPYLRQYAYQAVLCVLEHPEFRAHLVSCVQLRRVAAAVVRLPGLPPSRVYVA